MTSSELSLSVYSLDRHDAIVDVSPGFLVFARDNEAAHLTEASLVGTSIWDHVAGGATRELYAAVFKVVRDTQRTVRFPFRCDSPTCRRFMDLMVEPQAEEGLKLTAELLRAEPRPAVALLEPSAPRAGNPLEACSFCRSIHVLGRGWLEVEEAIGYLKLFDLPQTPPLTHTVCPRCLPDLRRRLGIMSDLPS